MKKFSGLTLFVIITLMICSSCQKEESAVDSFDADLRLEAVEAINTDIEEVGWTVDDLPGDGVHFTFDPSADVNTRAVVYDENVCGNSCNAGNKKAYGRIKATEKIVPYGSLPVVWGVDIEVTEHLNKPNYGCSEYSADSQKSYFYYAIKHWQPQRSGMKTLKSGVVYTNQVKEEVYQPFVSCTGYCVEGFLVYLYRYDSSAGKWCKIQSGWWTMAN